MKKTMVCMLLLLLAGVGLPAFAQETTGGGSASTDEKADGALSIEDRINRLEEAIVRPVLGDKWYDRIRISGLIEVELGYEWIDFDDPEADDETSGDLDLATVELGVDAKISDHVEGHVLFLYEDDDVTVDEGFITLSGTEAFPAYLIAGRQYIPFGCYDSHFVSDPLPLVLGETGDGAAVAGYRFGGELVDVSLGWFDARIDEIDSDDIPRDFVAAAMVAPLEWLRFGVSYTSNLAASDSLSEEVADPDGDEEANLSDRVGGVGVFATVQFLERFTFIGEFVGAISDFEAGELYDSEDPEDRRPAAWNVELGVGITETLEAAVRYGGSEDGGAEFLPEAEFGAVVNWSVFDCNLALEYMHREFEDDFQTTDTLTAQFAVEF